MWSRNHPVGKQALCTRLEYRSSQDRGRGDARPLSQDDKEWLNIHFPSSNIITTPYLFLIGSHPAYTFPPCGPQSKSLHSSSLLKPQRTRNPKVADIYLSPQAPVIKRFLPGNTSAFLCPSSREPPWALLFSNLFLPAIVSRPLHPSITSLCA